MKKQQRATKKTANKKRNRSDSTQAAQDLLIDALSDDMIPPAHVKLEARDMPFWNSLTRARARSLWTESDLENAAELARCKADIEEIRAQIRKEGRTVKNQKGTVIVNPNLAMLETITRRVIALSRLLQVHADATVGKARESRKVNESAREAKENASKIKKSPGSSLIPTRLQ